MFIFLVGGVVGGNPYLVNSWDDPAVLVGRETASGAVIDIFEALAKGRSSVPLVFSGVKCIGKTAFLSKCETLASSHGFFPMRLTCDGGEGLSADLLEKSSDIKSSIKYQKRYDKWLKRVESGSIFAGASRPRPPDTGKKKLFGDLSSLEVKLGVSALAVAEVSGSWAGPEADREISLSGKLSKAVQIAQANGYKGVVLLVDGLDKAPPDQVKTVMRVTSRVAVGPNPALGVVITGNPGVVALLDEHSDYSWRHISKELLPLSPEQSADLLTRTSEGSGLSWHPEALLGAVDTAGGVPFLLQKIGHASWERANSSGGQQILSEHTVEACQEAEIWRQERAVAEWERCSDDEKSFLLKAVAVMGEDRVFSLSDVVYRSKISVISAEKAIRSLSREKLIEPVPGKSIDYAQFVNTDFESKLRMLVSRGVRGSARLQNESGQASKKSAGISTFRGAMQGISRLFGRSGGDNNLANGPDNGSGSPKTTLGALPGKDGGRLGAKLPDRLGSSQRVNNAGYHRGTGAGRHRGTGQTRRGIGRG